jgi:hypothetical protein
MKGQDYPPDAPDPCGRFSFLATIMMAYAWLFGRGKS